MCQVAVYLDEEKFMDSVMLVEPLPEGVRLVKLFEPPLVVTAVIRQIDLMKNKLYLESIPKPPTNPGTVRNQPKQRKSPTNGGVP